MDTGEHCYIGDVAKRLGVSQRTIRYYEELGLITPTRTSGRFRVYAEAEIERLKTVMLLKSLGISLEDIVALIKLWHEGVPSEVTPKLRAILIERRQEFEKRIEGYRKGIEQLDEVLTLLNVCASCGHRVEAEECSHCLSNRNEDIPPLMKTLVQ